MPYPLLYPSQIASRVMTVALLVLCMMLLASPIWAHDVKDPVCRMTVDSDTTRFTQKLGNKTFFFCSKACQDRFQQSPQKYVALAGQLEKSAGRDYLVDLHTPATVVAGKPVELAFTIRYADTRQLVRDFELTHQKLLHLILVSEDLAWFEHQHPVRGADGIFRLTWTFPRAGRYWLYTDFTPVDGDNQVKPVPLTVYGNAAVRRPLTPDRSLTKQVGEVRVTLSVQPRRLRMEQATLLTYTLSDRKGHPLRDMQPFIGVMGHLIVLSQDRQQFVHTHVLNRASLTSTGEPWQVTPAMVTARGPTFAFKLTLPSGGMYRMWAQFMHHNRVVTVPFTVRVADLWEKTASK